MHTRACCMSHIFGCARDVQAVANICHDSGLVALCVQPLTGELSDRRRQRDVVVDDTAVYDISRLCGIRCGNNGASRDMWVTRKR